MLNAFQLIALTFRVKQLMRHRWCAILVFTLIILLAWRNIGYEQKICYYYLNWIRKIRHYLCKDTAKSLVHALEISRIDYCNSPYVGLPKSLTDRLQRIMLQPQN